jgi:heme exporter protein D
VEAWGAAIAGLLALLLAAVKSHQQRKATREEHADETYIQQARQALANNDADAFDAVVAEQHDRVERLLAGQPGSDSRGRTDQRAQVNPGHPAE